MLLKIISVVFAIHRICKVCSTLERKRHATTFQSNSWGTAGWKIKAVMFIKFWHVDLTQ